MDPRHLTPASLNDADNDADDAALAAIVRSSQDAVISKTIEGVVTAWNPGAEALYGYLTEEMLGRNIETTFPDDCLDQERERHARIAAGTGESGFRCARLRKDGGRIEVVMSMLPVRAESGAVIGLASISRPVSDSERIRERFEALLEAAPDAMICVDASARITVANAQVTNLFGYERDELLGLAVEVLVPEAARGAHVRHRDGFLAAPQARPMGSGLPLTGRRRDGTTFPVEVSLSSSGEGPDQLVIAAVRDVTQQRAAAAALRESEIRLRQLADNVETVFSLRQIDPPEYLFISPSFEKLTGYAVEDAYNDADLVARKLVHPDDQEAMRSRLYPGRLVDGASSEHRIIRSDGEVRWVRVMVNLVPQEDGMPARAVGMTDDITDRVLATQALAEAEAEARAANDAKNAFLSRMSHELRTPLNAVLGFGQLLELELEDTDQLDSVHHVLRAGRHLLSLINDVLDIARIEAGEMSFSLEPVGVREIVEEVRRLMEPIALSAGVTLEEVDGGPYYVLADTQRLRQILLNLVGNAIKYNRPGGRVWLGWRSHSGHVWIDVGDDGPGIASELQPRLFTPFDRLGAEATAIEGTGVGLALSRGLAELMAGHLDCRSSPGVGSVFTTSLPAAVSPVEALNGHLTEHPRLAKGHTPSGPQTLLYIEDNVANVQLMQSVVALRPEWKLVHAALGRLGLELAQGHNPDLILLDLHLPDVSGLEVLRQLRENAATAEIPVVVLSADANDGVISALLHAGAAQYVTKPFELDRMLRIMDAAATSTVED